MSVLLDRSFPRTLTRLTEELGREEHRGKRVEAWLFEDEESRRRAESTLARHGVEARFRSAYKPLVNWILEELDRDGLTGLHVEYPVHASAPKQRFLLEAYPLAAMFPDVSVGFSEGGESTVPTYRVTAEYGDGRTEDFHVPAPNRVHEDATGGKRLSPTGWIGVTAGEGRELRDERIETDFEALFEAALGTVSDREWGGEQPFFERLTIRADLPAGERSIGYGHEVLSLQEALHEDLYFSCLELFQRRVGLEAGDRSLQPGQIVPDVRRADGDPRLVVALEALDAEDRRRDDVDLETAERALGIAQVHALVGGFEGEAFEARSRAGRLIPCVYCKGTDPAVIVSGGQHANETSGVIGALRATARLAERPESHFALIALENPDGYALHQRLIEHHRSHMHHAARYTALGDDVERRAHEPLHERQARATAERLSGARLHVNLHGYPSHEWTRPLSGYIPNGFELWTVPKGFFIIMRHHSGWHEEARHLVDAVTRRLSAVPGLIDFNRRQIELFERHAGATNFEMVNGFPCLVSSDDRHGPPLTLITEFPDETIEDEAFVFAHTVQMETVLAAYEAHRETMSGR